MQNRKRRNGLRNWDDMRFFMAVYQAGSFAKAADRLKTDQSTVGRRIQSLEDHLGAKLFDRHGKGIRPTPTARGLLDYATEINDAVANIERRFGGIDGEVAGVVRVAATEGLAAAWLTPRLAGLQIAHPEILIEVIAGNERVDLSTRQADLAIRLGRPTEPKLVAQRVGMMRFAMFAAQSYVDRFGLPETFEELQAHRLVDHNGLGGAAMRIWRDLVAEHDAVVYRTNSSVAYQYAIQAGYGLGLMPAYSQQVFPDLTPVPLELDIASEIWLVSHEDTNNIRRTRIVIDYVRELFQRDHAEWFA